MTHPTTENESHTPGPWLLNADAARHEPGFYGSPSEPGDPEVYTSIHVGDVRLTAFIKPADARLIAAAPDLLEIVRVISTMDCFYAGVKCPDECQCVSARASRAIDKVEGRS